MRYLFRISIAFVFLVSCSSQQTDVAAEEEFVQIGAQSWMKKNLDVSNFRNGDPILMTRTDEEWENAGKEGIPAWCYYDNLPENGKKFGKIYNWYAVNDDRGLAPEGWRIPSNDDFNMLSEFLGGEEKAGLFLKSTYGWNENGNGSDNYGFNGQPGGSRNYNGFFYDIGNGSYWWASDEGNNKFAWLRYLYHGKSSITGGMANKEDGMYIRCIK
jgi:uncharacterized protein (TIGR02145 family)